VAYLGGVAVFLGMMGGILYSYIAVFRYEPGASGLLAFHQTQYLDDGAPYALPVSIIFGMTLIMMVGLLDDILGIPPRIKVGGQLVAAAALAATDVGVKVAAGVIIPLAKGLGLHTTLVEGGFETLLFHIPLPLHHLGIGDVHIPIDVVYWAGTLVIAVFVLGACNASNLIDGLDGLLSGTTAITAG
jgi:UDP-GlcNAc:undecaprenyl-phosphate GlcNAc-1-phosphate transferase